jgi:hypothetical protein
MGDHRGIDRIGLGPLAERLGKSTDLRRVDHGERQARGAPRLAATTVSKPPVASRATRGGKARQALAQSSNPAALRRRKLRQRDELRHPTGPWRRRCRQ